MTDPAATIAARAETHGDWRATAALAQAIKAAMAEGRNWRTMRDGQREALEMIATKIARACCGNADEADHWHDIAGYATLGGEG